MGETIQKSEAGSVDPPAIFKMLPKPVSPRCLLSAVAASGRRGAFLEELKGEMKRHLLQLTRLWLIKRTSASQFTAKEAEGRQKHERDNLSI